VAICKYDNQRPADLCGQNCEYITRLSKVAAIHYHNMPELENGIASDDLQSRRDAAMAYGETRELESRKNQRIKSTKTRINKQGKEVPMRQDRNHQTMIFSWDRTETPEKAIQMTREFLEEMLSDARAIYTVHTDKAGQTHTHVWIDNKLKDGSKLQIEPKTFYNFDSAWAKKFDSEYGTRYAPQFAEKSRETREWNKRKASAKKDGRDFNEPKPQRYGDLIKSKVKENMRSRESRDAGVIHHDQTRINADKRPVTAGREAVEVSERNIKQSQQSIEQRTDSGERTKQSIDAGEQRIADADRSFDSTIREAQAAAERVERNRLERDERGDSRGK
jgi:hypothetical protein